MSVDATLPAKSCGSAKLHLSSQSEITSLASFPEVCGRTVADSLNTSPWPRTLCGRSLKILPWRRRLRLVARKLPAYYPDVLKLNTPSRFWTAVQGLFHPARLGLVEPPEKVSRETWVFVYGGSSRSTLISLWGTTDLKYSQGSVGQFAIQLLHAAGYKVVTVSSKHNFDLCKSLGADAVFDVSVGAASWDVWLKLQTSTTIPKCLTKLRR